MDIALFNERIVIQKNAVTVDEIGNHTNAWTDYFNMKKWEQAIERAGIDMDFYTTRERSTDELLPWDFIDTGMTKAFMKREYEKARKGQTTKNCREGCGGCGCNSWTTGVCIEA